MPSSGALLSAVFVGSFVLIFFSLWILFFVKLSSPSGSVAAPNLMGQNN